jgi:hypothetical protein
VPAPAFPFNVFPYVVAGWLGVGVALAIGIPRLAQRVSVGLAAR